MYIQWYLCIPTELSLTTSAELATGLGGLIPILGLLPKGTGLKGRSRFEVEVGGILTNLRTSPGAGGNAGSQV